MLLAALPATPVQTAHACYRYGFEIVVPASWGDEIVAQAVLEDLRGRDREPVIQCTCPLVAGRLLANGEHLLASMAQTASPPVAAARYARHVFAPRQVHITYIGACPGADDSVIDQRFLPDEFLRMLDDRDIALADMPTVFDSVLPPDRRRFISLPGGCPSQEALWQASDGRMLREVTQPTFSTDLAQTLLWREYVMIDVAPSLGCACAGSYSRVGTRYGRVAVMALEPPRAVQPVVAYQPEFADLESERRKAEWESPIAQQSGDEANERTQPDAPARPGSAAAASLRDATDVASSAVRVRTPSASLPRAYLAKRRHLGSIARETAPLEAATDAAADTSAESVQSVEFPSAVVVGVEHAAADSVEHASAASVEHAPATNSVEHEPAAPATEAPTPEETLFEWRWDELPPREEPPTSVPDVRAHPNDRFAPSELEPASEPEPEPEFVPDLFTAAQEPSFAGHAMPHAEAADDAPNEQPDMGRPIAVHVEPGPTVMQDGPLAASSQPAAPSQHEERAPDEGPEVAIAVQERPAAIGEPEPIAENAPWEKQTYLPDEPLPTSPPSGPLRVEVVIDAEHDAAPPEPIIPDAVHDDATNITARQGTELSVRSARPWADVLIALWLVLVASAVLATLLWRR